MSWSGIANNQCVSLDNLKDAVATGVFTALTTIPAGSKQITKSEALTYVNIQTAPLAGKTNNQLVVKSELVAALYRYRAYITFNCIDLEFTSFSSVANYSPGYYYINGSTSLYRLLYYTHTTTNNINSISGPFSCP